MNHSIYIPYVFFNHTAEFITEIFHNYEIGVVSRVDYKKLDKYPNYYSAFVHFEYWYSSNNAQVLDSYFKTNSKAKTTINLSSNRYWIIKKMTIPKVSATSRSLKNCEVYEIPLREELLEMVAEMSKEIEDLQGKVVKNKHTYFSYENENKSIVKKYEEEEVEEEEPQYNEEDYYQDQEIKEGVMDFIIDFEEEKEKEEDKYDKEEKKFKDRC
jgi:hypothetical protein